MKFGESDFGDLLASAEQLTADIDGGRAGDLPRVERSLRHILDSGQSLLSSTSNRGNQDAKASILLGSRGVDLPSLSTRIDSIQQTDLIQQTEATPCTDIAGFLKSERENAILSLLEETKKETQETMEKLHWDSVYREWETDKQRILAAVAGGGADPGLADLTIARGEITRLHDTNLGGKSSLSNLELQYAKKVVQYNQTVALGGVRPDLMGSFKSLFPEEVDQEISVLWEYASKMADLPSSRPSADVVSRARSFLESSYTKFIKLTVFSNLTNAGLGGIPGNYHLVRSFLNVRVPATQPGLDDGLVDGVPVWALIYYCLRCGDLNAACEGARQAGPGLGDIHTLLQELKSSNGTRLSPQTESMVRIQYRRSVRQSSDPFKRAVYCVLAACDPQEEHSEIATSLDDYLWLKLCQVRDEESGDSLTLPGLQTLLSEEYGESHFNASEQPLLYFQVLFLTGQFETALDFLFRTGDPLSVHAVHLALALFELNLLKLPDSIQAPLISRESSDKSPSRRLNVARLVILFVKHFESTDPREALQYYYFLREMKGGRSSNLFMSCVGELVLESREFDLLLGQLMPDGSRTPGLVDKFGDLVDTGKIIEFVAADSEDKGLLEDAVQLYDLAKKHARVVELLNKLLSQVIAQPPISESNRDRLQRQAINIARRYKNMGVSGGKDSTLTLFLLLDLATFFDLYHAGRSTEALDTLERVKVVPLNQSDVDYLVSGFKLLDDSVRRNIPDVLLAAMSILHNQYKTQPHSSVRDKARCLISYAGMIPYRLPGDTTSRLVQMEVLMS
ncbi:nuclear pore complex protein Nup93 [Eurytemora carolleeae]|uniref:nuclear pore complex protein Nup93 n=1 Tax=Eurytemora carolleeae TaxID=1294199 RepID=UPI000C75F340|nr:nuclear pore complex protein Nup93 [Eurytemora carolleeae]XP_023321822.1 nuclear pore complex protein Nup93 [Eurytemora carolleeae]XP_023321823.1 nuclear pore complex protein Nup93 [Eurytemora carolleeae]XP_023321824.1 nuclear pore complex protein Nup93 [Eurytemora carolleeae]|eukprot:XP_023321821.1 nuclear pore complex protein Nup93-like [Eurytemora affinis]